MKLAISSYNYSYLSCLLAVFNNLFLYLFSFGSPHDGVFENCLPSESTNWIMSNGYDMNATFSPCSIEAIKNTLLDGATNK